MKIIKKLFSTLLVMAMLLPFGAALAAEDGFNGCYTYNYDYWGEIIQSPDAYRVDTVLYSAELGLETAINAPKSMFVRDSELYVCDTGNNRIIQLHRDKSDFSVVRIIDHISGAEPSGFASPSDVFVDENGNIYVADTNNNRVIMADKDLNYLASYIKPDSNTYDQKLSFLPNKLVVDSSGRVYVLATNVNKGLIKYEADGTFSGYIGANQVKYNLWDYVWKMYFTTKEQRSQQAAFVPTEYENIYIDRDGFIYATNTVFSEYDLLYDNAKPIRRLNAIGTDILIKNGKYPPIGDLDWVEQSQQDGPSKFKDITVLENDIYVAVDRTRGRIFGYDSQGILLWAFGNKGNSVGSFSGAVSIEHMGKDLLVMDELNSSITLFTPTEYGNLVYYAIEQYLKGDYQGSADTWREVLKFNANYDLAFIGIGRALMQQEKYEEAMKYFKMAHDRINYGRAYRYYRKELVEKNILWIVVVVAVLIVVSYVIRKIKKIKWEVKEYERQRVIH